MLFFLIELLKTWFEVIIACLAVKIFCWRKDPAPVGLPDVRKVCRKVFRWLWKKISGLTIRFYHSIPTWLWDSFKKSHHAFYISLHTFWLMCYADALFFPTQTAWWSEPSRYFEHVSEVYGELAKAFEGRLPAQNIMNKSSWKLSWNFSKTPSNIPDGLNIHDQGIWNSHLI